MHDAGSAIDSANFLAQLTPKQIAWRQRFLSLSFAQKYSHLGSGLSCLDIIGGIYAIKKPEDLFILSNGHAGVAWYVILEDHGLLVPETTSQLNIHPDRDEAAGIMASTGSLGQGLPIAVGMALANPDRVVYCLISDGEAAEGSIWEALRIAADHKLANLKIICNVNGWAAYDPVVTDRLYRRFQAFWPEITQAEGHRWNTVVTTLQEPSRQGLLPFWFATTVGDQFEFLVGQDAHYKVMSETEFQLAATELEVAAAAVSKA